MDFDFNEQMKIDGKARGTANQRNIIFKEELEPLKAKISQILLYDTETALQLLQNYNEIAKKGEEVSIDTILANIEDLKARIQEYENGKGKEEVFKEQSKIISNQLEELQANFEKMDIEDFEYKFSEIKELYNKNLENYSYADRDFIAEKIAILQAKIIIKKVRDGAIDLHDEISKDDEARLTMTINNSIFTLMQSQNPNIQSIVNEIKYKMIDRTDAVYDPEIWRLLDTAQGSGEKIEQRRVETQKREVETTTTLPAIQTKRKGFNFPDFSQIFSRNTIKIGDQSMKIAKTVQIGDTTINVKDLAKISMDWLSEQVPQEMLIDIESKKLKKEGKKKTKDIYVPDAKTPIYDEFLIKARDNYSEYYFYNESGIKLHLPAYSSFLVVDSETKIEGNFDRFNAIRKNTNIINYAKLIDSILKSNLEQQLLNELGVFVEKQLLRSDIKKSSYTDDEKDKKIMSKLPIFSNLLKSYNNIKKQVEETQIDFRGEEKAKRDKFYEERQSQFKNDLKVEKDKKKEKNWNLKSMMILRNLVNTGAITSDMYKILTGEITSDEILKSFIKENEGQNQTQQNNSQTENTNEENGDGTEYRGG